MFKQFTCLSACFLSVLVASVHFGVAHAQEVNGTLQEAEIVDVSGFVRGILLSHPDLKAAAAALEEATASERQADRPIYNPEFYADYEDAVDKTVEAGLAQTVDWAGKKKAAYAVSGSSRRAAEAEYQLARNQIAADVFQSLSEYWVATDLLALAMTSKSLMHDFAQQAKMRYQAGDMMRVEYETAELAYAEVRMRVAELDANRTAVVHSLVAFGAPVNPGTWPKIPSSMPAGTLGLRDANQIISELPRVAAANAFADAASANVELAKAMKKPDPTFAARVGDEDGESLVGLTFSIPLFVRNNFDENVLAALSAKSKVEAEADSIERGARMRLMVAIERYTTMKKAWDDWELVGASSLQVRTELLTRLWEARELNMSEFLLQFRQTLETQKTAVELRQTVWNAWADYLRESNRVDAWLSHDLEGAAVNSEATRNEQ